LSYLPLRVVAPADCAKNSQRCFNSCAACAHLLIRPNKTQFWNRPMTMSQRISLDNVSMRRLIEGLAARLSEIAKQPAPFLKPPQIAKMLGVKTDKVLLWIRNDELKSTNVAATQGIGSRPRYRVSSKDLDSFLLRRMVMPPSPSSCICVAYSFTPSAEMSATVLNPASAAMARIMQIVSITFGADTQSSRSRWAPTGTCFRAMRLPPLIGLARCSKARKRCHLGQRQGQRGAHGTMRIQVR
jgi:hypothetical protein